MGFLRGEKTGRLVDAHRPSVEGLSCLESRPSRSAGGNRGTGAPAVRVAGSAGPNHGLMTVVALASRDRRRVALSVARTAQTENLGLDDAHGETRTPRDPGLRDPRKSRLEHQEPHRMLGKVYCS